jgi:hypothetical protein
MGGTARLDAQGLKSKCRTITSGRLWGGKPFARGALYLMLQNRIYRGEIVHKQPSYPGERNSGGLRTVSSPRGARSLTEMTMDDKEGYSSEIAAESVGERLGSPPPDAGEQTPRPAATSAGSEARVAVKTAESIGERVGDAYADATPQEARERSRNAVRLRHGATQAGAQAAGGGLSRQFDQHTFSVFTAFAVGYAAALFIHRRSQ